MVLAGHTIKPTFSCCGQPENYVMPENYVVLENYVRVEKNMKMSGSGKFVAQQIRNKIGGKQKIPI